ncbi:MAG: aldo/keto reductase [Myxococcales bacterium]|nr:aldo/keto reductase [Myxococcales bacterium]
MEYRRLGASDLEAPTVVYGAWAIGGWYWGGTDDRAAVAALQRAIDVGMNAVDTAPMYGCGHSERLVGQAIRGRRDRVLVLTKCGMRWDREDGVFSFRSEDPQVGKIKVHITLKPDSVIEECERSLRRLGTDHIDLYQCHWPDPTTPAEDTMAALLKLRDQGKIRAIGTSNSSPELLDRFLSKGSVASEQPRYSPLDRRIEEKIVPYCLEKGIGLLVYSPLEQGLLTGKVTMDRTFDAKDERGALPWFQPANRRRVLDALDLLRPIAAEHRCTLGQLALAWIIGRPGITSAIVGARTAAQVEENAGAGDIVLTTDQRARVTAVYESLGKPRKVTTASRVFEQADS